MMIHEKLYKITTVLNILMLLMIIILFFRINHIRDNEEEVYATEYLDGYVEAEKDIKNLGLREVSIQATECFMQCKTNNVDFICSNKCIKKIGDQS